MPVYTYHCENCDHEFDKQQSFSDNSLKSCPECKKRALRKVYKPALVLFKGSGYYVTDNRSSSKSQMNNVKSEDNDKSESSNGSSESKSETKSETKTKNKSESKAESKTDSKSSGSNAKEKVSK